MTLDGLADAAGVAKQSLHSAVDFARRKGFEVNDCGAVTVPGGAHIEHAEEYQRQAQELINDAVRDAIRIDADSAAELQKLTDAVHNTDMDKARNDIQSEASQNELQMIRDTLPTGKDPATVAAWWNSLTQKQREDLEKAVPVDLYDLNGIPQDVKNQLRGNDGYDRVELVRWAQQNWNNDDIDIYDNNCTNFVSAALEHAGMKEKMSPWTGTFGDNSWGHGMQTGWGWLDSKDYSHTASWAQADAQRNFMLKNGGEQVSFAQARPGDIVYFEQAGPDGPTDPGKAHHAALVTSVTPDGDIHYTQHTDSRLNVSLNGRLPHNEVTEGDQNIVIVRPKPNWY
jgi:hypothetical protein